MMGCCPSSSSGAVCAKKRGAMSSSGRIWFLRGESASQKSSWMVAANAWNLPCASMTRAPRLPKSRCWHLRASAAVRLEEGVEVHDDWPLGREREWGLDGLPPG
jgi:hypothetical protein